MQPKPSKIDILFYIITRFPLLILIVSIIALDRLLKQKLKFPRDIQELEQKTDWCLQVLKQVNCLPEKAVISNIRIQPFQQYIALRSSLAKIKIDYQLQEKEFCFSCIAKLSPTAGSFRDQVIYVLQQNHTKEVNFYNKLSAILPVRIPQVYFADANPLTGNMCILLEDMSNWQVIEEYQGCPREKAKLSVAAMAKLHASFWEIKNSQTAWLKPLQPAPLLDLIGYQYKGINSQAVQEVWQIAWRRGNRQPLTIIHGDWRVGNLLFSANTEEVAILDWQCIRQGQGVFDLAYFINLSLNPELRREQEETLLNLYHQELLKNGVQGYNFEQCQADYCASITFILLLVTIPMLNAETSADEKYQEEVKRFSAAWSSRLTAISEDIDYETMAKILGIDASTLQQVWEIAKIIEWL
ncbi:MAG: oxidoreductase family protein [Coleofasciculaceae cyanobacterium]